MTGDVWQQTLKVIQGKVNPQVFETWFLPTEFISLNRESITVEVPNKPICNLLSRRYRSLIENSLSQVTETALQANFVVTSSPVAAGTPSPVRIAHPPRSLPRETGLNPKYRFDSYVVGSSNNFAHAAARAVAEHPAGVYNPLFIYGGVGLGKTHLMHAIGHSILENDPNRRLLYVSSETFTNEVIRGIREDRMEALRRKFRDIDCLLIDDIQFISGKESTQIEFFHTFNALYEAQKQIVISCDQSPKEMGNTEERLQSRYEMGLSVDIQPPSLETKIAILQRKADQEGISIPDSVIQFIAEHSNSNIRETEGALNRVSAYASLTRQPLTLEFAREILRDILGEEECTVTVERIQTIVARYFDVKPALLRSKSRTRNIARPRQVAMYLSRELTDLSLPQIGRSFGGKDHTTVLYSCNQVRRKLQLDPTLRKALEALRQQLTGNGAGMRQYNF